MGPLFTEEESATRVGKGHWNPKYPCFKHHPGYIRSLLFASFLKHQGQADPLSFGAALTHSSSLAGPQDCLLFPGTSDASSTVSEDALFRDKLKHMGKCESRPCLPPNSSKTGPHGRERAPWNF